ncbi:hypothetical protein [Thalassovita aquimarina]|uniref:hypothetical protein n=1 Tax=Thalassovita aquimarina TaxID=2785917 RepID=UPI003569C625
MTADGPVSDWATAVVSFLSDNLPRLDKGLEHDFSTAYQIGCSALVALGQADETEYGATPRPNPEFPEKLPRWDDICIAVLKLAKHQNKLSYRLQNGDKPPASVVAPAFTIVPLGRQPTPPPPNNSPSRRLGAAQADPAVISAMNALGLVAVARWTDEAETVLWRIQPRAWGMDIASDPRFAEAVKNTVYTVPSNIQTQFDQLVTITEDDVASSMASHEAALKEPREKCAPNARAVMPKTAAEIRRSLAFQRRNTLDWMFFRHWRLSDNWLSDDQAGRALPIFHDPLAIQMRQAVIARLYPELPDFAQ